MTLCAVALAVLSASGALALIGILAVIFATGVASGFERPALTALEAQVVPRDEAARGVSFLSSVSQGGAILGPAAGGIAIAVVGIPATYGAIAAPARDLDRLPRADRAASRSPSRIAGEPMLQSLLGGIRYVARTPALVGSMALDLFAVFFGGAIALLPIFATDILHVGPVGLGRAPDGAVDRGAARHAHRDPPAAEPSRRPDAPRLRRRVRAEHDRLRRVDDLRASRSSPCSSPASPTGSA